MASGDPAVQVIRAMPPAANYATLDTIDGASTPAERILVWDFDSATVEYVDFLCVLHNYDGGGLTFTLGWAAEAATGNAVWSVAIRRIPDDTEDLDTTAHTYAYNDAAADAAPTVIGEVTYTSITFTDGTDMDDWANGELAIVRVRRFATDAGDTINSNDCQLLGMIGLET